MKNLRFAFFAVVLCCGPVVADDFGLDEAGDPATPADPWVGITQLFPDPATQSGKGSGEGRGPSPQLELVGEFDLPDTAPEGLSGIAWTSNPGHPQHAGFPFSHSEESFDICGPDSYALCEDSGGWIHYAEIGVDRGSGAVTSAVFHARERLVGMNESSDLEAIAYARSRWNRTHLQLYVSDEHHRCIAQDRPLAVSIPSPVVAIFLPQAIRAHRSNKGVEAMCLSPDDQALWLANEDALPEDGPVATTEHGALVRLWRMDAIAGASEAGLRKRRAQGGPGPVEPAWWFYELDPATGTSLPHLPEPFNGLAELCALPDGRLLALERGYGYRTRSAADPRGSLITVSIYLIDPLHAEGAESNHHAEFAESAEAAVVGEGSGEAEPPTSAARTAAAQRPAVLAKTLLWRGLTGRANYEGMTLGPALADGSRTLLLVADGDVSRKGRFEFVWRKSLLSFRLRLPAAGP